MITVKLDSRSYPVLVADGILKDAGRLIAGRGIKGAAFIITNPYLKKTYSARFVSSLGRKGFECRIVTVPDSELSKSLRSAGQVLQELCVFSRGRTVFVAALGGGVIGDLAGFVASVFKRGVAFVQVPTTLLAQVDSAIGGKNGLDCPAAKNMIGTFYQPKIVISDVSLLKTLDRRQLANGLSEVIKYAAIADAQLFAYLEKQRSRIQRADKQALKKIVSRCSRIKAGIVGKDEKEEKGLRTVLNFGHTLGHALEAAEGFSGISHGEAVAVGMVAACRLSEKLGLLAHPVAGRIEKLIAAYGLPVCIKNISLNKVFNALALDKKFRGKVNRFVLLAGIGKPVVVKGIDQGIIAGILKGLS